jgi:hypothetical protein
MDDLKSFVDSVPYALIIIGLIIATPVWVVLTVITLRDFLSDKEVEQGSVGFALLFWAMAIAGFVVFREKGVAVAALAITVVRGLLYMFSRK